MHTVTPVLRIHAASPADWVCKWCADVGEAFKFLPSAPVGCPCTVCLTQDGVPGAQDVAKVAVAIVKQAEGVSTAEAEAILKKVSDTGRIQKDVW